jgi:hypothetical protein
MSTARIAASIFQAKCGARGRGCDALQGGKDMKRSIALIPLFTIALAACASAPPPTEQLAAGKSAVQAAQLAGASEHAPVALAQAASKLRAAETAMREEQFVEARRLAQEATVDAELAQALAGSARAQHSAQQVDQSIRALRSELEASDATGAISGRQPQPTR